MDLGFVKFKSNGTKAKRPVEHLQKAQGAKKQRHFFFFFIGGFAFLKFKSNGTKAKRPVEHLQYENCGKCLLKRHFQYKPNFLKIMKDV